MRAQALRHLNEKSSRDGGRSLIQKKAIFYRKLNIPYCGSQHQE